MPVRKSADRHDPDKQVSVGIRIPRNDYDRLERRRGMLGLSRRQALIAAIRDWLDAPAEDETTGQENQR